MKRENPNSKENAKHSEQLEGSEAVIDEKKYSVARALTGQAGVSLFQFFNNLVKNTVIRNAAILLARFLAGFVLSQAVVFERFAPFGVSIVSASNGGMGGVFTLLGAVFGYLTVWSRVDSLKYIAIIVLVYAAGIVFRGTSIEKKQIFMPLTAAITTLFIGVVFLTSEGVTVKSAVLYFTEIILITGTAFFYRTVFTQGLSDGGTKRSLSTLILAASVFLALSNYTVMDVIVPARVAAGCFVLVSAYKSGMGSGSITGLLIGVAIDLGIGYPFFSMSYGLSGMMAGVFKKWGKLASACSYVVAGAVAALWAGTSTLLFASAVETFVASVVFMLLPLRKGMRIEEAVSNKKEVGARAQKYAFRKLGRAATAFRELYESVNGFFEKDKYRNDNDMTVCFERAADKVCRRCAMRQVCWDIELEDTRRVLSDASVPLTKSGHIQASDFPTHFTERCVQFSKLLSAANDEVADLLHRRQYRARLQESRLQVTKQYAEVSRILEQVAEEVSQGVMFDPVAEERLERYVDTLHAGSEVSVYKDMQNRRHVEIFTPSASKEGSVFNELLNTDELRENISKCVGFTVAPPEQLINPDGERLIFSDLEELEITIGAAAHKKQGQKMSGDSGAWFKTADGKVFVILADGMGSGSDAARDSTTVCKLLERFLRAGVQPKVALEMLNSALILKGDTDTGLVTVDLVVCNLFTGESHFYKHGASCSYVKHGQKVNRVSGGALPIGTSVAAGESGNISKIMLTGNEMVIMLSDGVSVSDEDEWVRQLIAGFKGKSPKELAEKVLETAVLRHGRGDDMTVIALSISENAGYAS